MDKFNEFFEHVIKRTKEIIKQHGEDKVLPLFFFGHDDKNEVSVVTVPLDENKSIFEYFPSAISTGVPNADWMVFVGVGDLYRVGKGVARNVLIISGLHFKTRKFTFKVFKIVRLEEDYEFDDATNHPLLIDFRKDFEKFIKAVFDMVKEEEVMKGESL